MRVYEFLYSKIGGGGKPIIDLSHFVPRRQSAVCARDDVPVARKSCVNTMTKTYIRKEFLYHSGCIYEWQLFPTWPMPHYKQQVQDKAPRC